MNRVHDLDGKDYRLLQNNLDKDIVADESKILVKKDKVIVKLQKVSQTPCWVVCSSVWGYRTRRLAFARTRHAAWTRLP